MNSASELNPQPIKIKDKLVNGQIFSAEDFAGLISRNLPKKSEEITGISRKDSGDRLSHALIQLSSLETDERGAFKLSSGTDKKEDFIRDIFRVACGIDNKFEKADEMTQFLFDRTVEIGILEFIRENQKYKFTSPKIKESLYKIYIRELEKSRSEQMRRDDRKSAGINQISLSGQSSAIGKFTPWNEEDTASQVRIEHAPEVIRWMDEGTDEARSVSVIRQDSKDKPDEIRYAIRLPSFYEDKKSVGRAEGWILLIGDDERSLTQAHNQNLRTVEQQIRIYYLNKDNNTPPQELDDLVVAQLEDRAKVLSFLDKVGQHNIWEISFARDMEEHIVASGVRQVCSLFPERVGAGVISMSDKTVAPGVGIVAFVDIDHPEAMRVVEAAGFVYMGNTYKYANKDKEMMLYVLDQEKLDRIMIGKYNKNTSHAKTV